VIWYQHAHIAPYSAALLNGVRALCVEMAHRCASFPLRIAAASVTQRAAANGMRWRWAWWRECGSDRELIRCRDACVAALPAFTSALPPLPVNGRASARLCSLGSMKKIFFVPTLSLYATLPHPLLCWCALRLPAAFSRTAESKYRACSVNGIKHLRNLTHSHCGLARFILF